MLLGTPNLLSNCIFETMQAKGFRWRVYHPSLQTAWGLRKELTAVGFMPVRFLKTSPLSQHKVEQLPRAVRWFFRHIPWRRLPVWCQTNIYVVATKSHVEEPVSQDACIAHSGLDEPSP